MHVPSGLHLQCRFFAATRRLWRWLGQFESRILADEIDGIEIDRPIYVCSLARAGTTVVTEMLERHPDLTSHHYSDFPNVWTPYWRNDLLQKTRRELPALTERAHGDRIRVSNDSPEAVEEILWMAFIEGLHDPARPNVLDGSTPNAIFDAYYANQIRKLLAVRKAPRYLAKGNYNISRLEYLLKLFPSARFVIPIREPAAHVASLARQHERFLAAHSQDPRVGRQLSLAEHFEFGPHRTCINFGNPGETRQILEDWAEGRETEGWARYWAATYHYLGSRLEANPTLAQACFLFRYEDLCQHSETVIDAMTRHCELSDEAFSTAREEYAQTLSLPTYYQPSFSARDVALISRHCQPPLEALTPHIKRPV